jgi:hypothetical protein
MFNIVEQTLRRNHFPQIQKTQFLVGTTALREIDRVTAITGVLGM